MEVSVVRPIRHQATGFDQLAIGIHTSKIVLRGEVHQPLAVVEKHAIRENDHCFRLLCLNGGKSGFDIRFRAHGKEAHDNAKHLGSAMNLLLRKNMERVVRIPEDRYPRELREHLSQKRKALAFEFGSDGTQAGKVSARMSRDS